MVSAFLRHTLSLYTCLRLAVSDCLSVFLSFSFSRHSRCIIGISRRLPCFKLNFDHSDSILVGVWGSSGVASLVVDFSHMFCFSR